MDEERFNKWLPPHIIDGKLTEYHWLVQHKKYLTVGYKSDLGAFCYINAKFGIIIEDNVQVGSHCSLYSVSTIDDKKGRIILKKNCKIGTHTTIMPNVIIGENSIVGAHSLVIEDIPANVVAYGVPAKIIRQLDEK